MRVKKKHIMQTLITIRKKFFLCILNKSTILINFLKNIIFNTTRKANSCINSCKGIKPHLATKGET